RRHPERGDHGGAPVRDGRRSRGGAGDHDRLVRAAGSGAHRRRARSPGSDDRLFRFEQGRRLPHLHLAIVQSLHRVEAGVRGGRRRHAV
nr:hypothetical protein [Tanacetum cinerariifolium]